jgi:transcriptional regulator with XRE-family HTH domain
MRQTAWRDTRLIFEENMLIDEIQKKIREAIAASGLSQKEIAAKIGVNPSTVSKYMRLNKYPAIDTFALLCKTVDVSSDEILGLTEE